MRRNDEVLLEDLLTWLNGEVLDDGSFAEIVERSGPAVRRIAATRRLDGTGIRASGRDGRWTKSDALKAIVADAPPGISSLSARRSVTSASAPAPTAPTAIAQEAHGRNERREPMSRIRQTIARRLKSAQNTAAILTTFNEIDMHAVIALRKTHQESFTAQQNVRLGFMSFFILAVVEALREVPVLGARIEGHEIVYPNYADIGVAVSTPRGLMVPNLRDCQNKDMGTIERELATLATQAREGRIGMSALQGGVFTITNGGVFGSLLSTPILNPPQSGILGLHRTKDRPVVIAQEDTKSIAIRPMMYVALSYDHRIVDGQQAVLFLLRIKETLEKPRTFADWLQRRTSIQPTS